MTKSTITRAFCHHLFTSEIILCSVPCARRLWSLKTELSLKASTIWWQSVKCRTYLAVWCVHF